MACRSTLRKGLGRTEPVARRSCTYSSALGSFSLGCFSFRVVWGGCENRVSTSKVPDAVSNQVLAAFASSRLLFGFAGGTAGGPSVVAALAGTGGGASVAGTGGGASVVAAALPVTAGGATVLGDPSESRRPVSWNQVWAERRRLCCRVCAENRNP